MQKRKKRAVGFFPPRSSSLNHDQQVGVGSEATNKEGEEEDEEEDVVVHEVWVDIVEFDKEEAVVLLLNANPDCVWADKDENDEDEIPWYEQDYEELPWWEYPDLDEDDDIRARCKEIVRQRLKPSENNNDFEFWRAVQRVEALVTIFALKVKNKREFTVRQKQQTQNEEEYEDVELSVLEDEQQAAIDDESATEDGEEFAEEQLMEEKEVPLENNPIHRGKEKSVDNCRDSAEMDEESVAKAVEEAILEVLGETASQFLGPSSHSRMDVALLEVLGESPHQDKKIKNQNQVPPLQHGQQEEIKKLLHPSNTKSTPTSKQQHQTSEATERKASSERRSRRTMPEQGFTTQSSRPSRSSRSIDDAASIHSVSLFSTGGFSRLNIHNAELKRYQKNKRRNKQRNNTQRWWTDDHTVAYPSAEDEDDEKSVSSFQSSPAMMEYARTKVSLFHNASGKPRRQPLRRVNSKDDSSLGWSSMNNKKSSSTEPLGKKKRRKKKGQLGLFMAKEKIKQQHGDDENNIFDIVEEAAHTQPELPTANKEDNPQSEEQDIPGSGQDNQVGAPEQTQDDTENGSKCSTMQTSRQDRQKLQVVEESHVNEENGKDSPKLSVGAQDKVALGGSNTGPEDVTGGSKSSTLNSQPNEKANNGNLQRDQEAASESATSKSYLSALESKMDGTGRLAVKSSPNKDPHTGINRPKNDAATASTKSIARNKEPKREKTVNRASKTDLGYSSVHLPDSEPRYRAKQLIRRFEDNSKKTKQRVQPLLVRRASTSEIEFNKEKVGAEEPSRDDNNYKSSTNLSSSELKDDPKFRLVMLRHAAVCTQAQYGGICPSDPTCSQMKELLKHMTLCKHQSTSTPCPFPGCSESKCFLVTMHRNSENTAEQKKSEEKMPPGVSVGEKSSMKEGDDSTDIGEHSDGKSNPISEDDNANAAKIRNDLLVQTEHCSKRNSLQKDMQRRTSWTGSVELLEHREQLEAREKARQEEAKTEVSDLRRRHNEVKARVEKAKREAAETERLTKVKAEQKEKLKRIKAEQAEKAERLEERKRQTDKSKEERKTAMEATKMHELEIQRIKSEAKLKVQQIEAEAAKREVEKKEKMRREELEKQQSEADLRKRHEEIKARLKIQNGKDPEEEISKLKAKKKKRRKSMPANAGLNAPGSPSKHGRSTATKPDERVNKESSEVIKEQNEKVDEEARSHEKVKATRRSSLPASPGQRLPSNGDRRPTAPESAEETEKFRRICRKMSNDLANEKNKKFAESEKQFRDTETAVVTARGARIEQAAAKDLIEGDELRSEFKKEAEQIENRGIVCNPALASSQTAQAILKKRATGKTEAKLEFERLKAEKLAKKEKKKQKEKLETDRLKAEKLDRKEEKKRNSFMGRAKKALGM